MNIMDWNSIQEAIDTLQEMIDGEAMVVGELRIEGKLDPGPEGTRTLRALVAGQRALKTLCDGGDT